MTLTQAHAWCYSSAEGEDRTTHTGSGSVEPDTQDYITPRASPRSTGDARTGELTLTQAHEWLDKEGHSQGNDPAADGEGDPVPSLRDISHRMKADRERRSALRGDRDRETDAPRNKAHEQFLQSVRAHRPDRCNAFDLGSGEATPVMRVDPRTGRVVEGSKAISVTRRERRAGDWARDNASREDACIETIQEETEAQEYDTNEPSTDHTRTVSTSGIDREVSQETDDERLVRHLRTTEAPLPQMQDRWGNTFTYVGYGEGDYYRLSRQPVWIIRQLLQSGSATQDTTATEHLRG